VKPVSLFLRVALCFLGLALTMSGCSVILDKSAIQCRVDDDCAGISAGSICSSVGVCVDSGLGPKGCFGKEPKVDAELINACSASECVPFDNCARLNLCNGAALPPLVVKP
jgi:hypothetical protein